MFEIEKYKMLPRNKQKRQSDRLIWLKAGFILAGVATTLGWILQLSQSNFLIKSITSEKCQTDRSFVLIPKGEFIAGSDRTERDYGYQISALAIATESQSVADAEAKLRQVGWFEGESIKQTQSLPSFCISRNLVTNEEYQAFVDATHYNPPGISEAEYQKQGFLVHPYSAVKSFLWVDGKYPEGKGQHPVVLVSYQDAVAYADWKGEQAGETYRLPTATEWEKASRGTDGRYFPWGNEWNSEGTNWAGSKLEYTSAIAQFPLSRSAYGVEDMAGNVFEFTSTLISRNTDTVSIMKGCSWDDFPGFCRSAYQHTRPIQSRHILFGFRLVKD